MPTFLSLPQEVLLDIAERLPRRSLYALGLACRHTYIAANPVLWGDLRFEPDYIEHEVIIDADIHGPYFADGQHLEEWINFSSACILFSAVITQAVSSETLGLIRRIAVLNLSQSVQSDRFAFQMGQLFDMGLLSGIREVVLEYKDRFQYSGHGQWANVRDLTISITNFTTAAGVRPRLKMTFSGTRCLRVLTCLSILPICAQEVHYKGVDMDIAADSLRTYFAGSKGFDIFEFQDCNFDQSDRALIGDLQSITGLSCIGFATTDRDLFNGHLREIFDERLWIPPSFQLDWRDKILRIGDGYNANNSPKVRLFFFSKRYAASLPLQYICDGSGFFLPEGYDAKVLAATPGCIHVIVNDLSFAAINVLTCRQNDALKTLSVRCRSKLAHHACDTAAFDAITSTSPNLRFLLFSAHSTCIPTDGFIGRVLDRCRFLETLIVEPYGEGSTMCMPLEVGEESVTIPFLGGPKEIRAPIHFSEVDKRRYFEEWVLHSDEFPEVAAQCDADSDERLRPGAAAWFELVRGGMCVQTPRGLFAAPEDVFSLDVAGLRRHFDRFTIEGSYEPWPKAEVVCVEDSTRKVVVEIESSYLF